MARGGFRVALTVITAGLAAGYLLLSGIRDSSLYYLTVGELTSRCGELEGRRVRVVGRVGDIDKGRELSALRFYLSDDDSSLYVIYRGPRPGSFGKGIEVMAEGKLGHDRVFRADRLLTRCPSKYRPRDNG